MTIESGLPWVEPFPVLLRTARAAYGAAVRAALAESGFDDMPRNGGFVVTVIANTGAPLSQIISELRVSKQAAGQLVDTLVTRGYLERAVDPADRRRLTVSLTERGIAAADTVRSVVRQISDALTARVGEEYVVHARVTIAALADISRELSAGAGDGADGGDGAGHDG
jgi:DNA-binding MarR family transcriptional regulator